MLQAAQHAVRFKRILNFGEGQGQPTEEQLREADRNGALRWKEKQDILHIRTAVPDGCICDLCETVRSVNAQTTDKSLYASASVTRCLDLLLKMRKGIASPSSAH
jgi:hypothetical protein